MAKTVRGELLGKKNVSSVDSAAVSGSGADARDRRRPDTDIADGAMVTRGTGLVRWLSADYLHLFYAF
jgi:hypothetical protein